MSYFVQYHNCDVNPLPLSDSPFEAGECGIHTKRGHIQQAQGTVFLIAGLGKPRRYFLWEAFELEHVEREFADDGTTEYCASGPGWQLCPPQRLEGKPFDAFRKACANFISFRCIDDLPYCKTLRKLAEEFKPPRHHQECEAFLRDILPLVREPDDIGFVENHLRRLGNQSRNGDAIRALSIRQPHAEAIMRGAKTIEYRTKPTRIRGTIQIYASQGRYGADHEAELMADYGIDDLTSDELPRGVLIGTVELYDCNDDEWHLRNPKRAATLLKPRKQPQPVWFNPF